MLSKYYLYAIIYYCIYYSDKKCLDYLLNILQKYMEIRILYTSNIINIVYLYNLCYNILNTYLLKIVVFFQTIRFIVISTNIATYEHSVPYGIW